MQSATVEKLGDMTHGTYSPNRSNLKKAAGETESTHNSSTRLSKIQSRRFMNESSVLT